MFSLLSCLRGSRYYDDSRGNRDVAACQENARRAPSGSTLASSTLTREASEAQKPGDIIVPEAGLADVAHALPEPVRIPIVPCSPGRTRVETIASSSASAGKSPSTPTYILNMAAYA